ncbi:hypothetical protein N7495_009077 [Penicillium taxi]|uniref:uncharacterized protein n=1 Tax=Penicillium taxi TaxID=168475 RepID=UPI0025457709|nr:uncharacterized protein N7495_009077 [Penicillium taxi]KAJ5889036.1 hypothetical protein N7495_009077 [Penicillium taxi]
MDSMNKDMTQMSDFSAGVAVLVMGMTGVGKSTFISKLIGGDTGIGHELTSYTQGVEFHSMMVKDRPVYLVDTPGFNDTYRVSFEELQAFRIYVRLGCCTRMFLVTTMWDSIDGYEAQLRESQLLTTRQFWGRFFEQGSQAKRWRGGEGSALLIVDELISLGERGGCKSLLIQKEVVDEGKHLKETTAGLELMSEYIIAEKALIQEMRFLQSDESVSQHDATTSLSELKKEIREMKQAQKKLRVSTQELFAEREHSYSKVLSKMRDEQQKLSGELQEQKRQYQRLQNEMKRDDKLHAEENDIRNKKRADLEHQERIGCRRRDSIEIEYKKIQEEESLFEEYLGDFKQENESSMSQISQDMQELRKRDVLKRNIFPILGLLAGVGLTAVGTATGLFPLAGAGVGLTVSSASEIKLSRKVRHEASHENYHSSFVSNSSTTTLNGAQLSGFFSGNN